MDFGLRIATTDALPIELSRQTWLLEREFNLCLRGKDFQSPRQNYGIWVELMPPDPLRVPPKNQVQFDRRDGAVRSSVVGDFETYKSASFPEVIDLFVIDAARALQQIPKKFLLPEEMSTLIECLETARIHHHRDQFGAAVERKDLSKTDNRSSVSYEESEGPAQIILQWLDDRLLPADASEFYSTGEADDITVLEDLIEAASHGLYFVDGHDIGAGTLNIFLYADDKDSAISRLIALADESALPSGVRIGAPNAGRAAMQAFYPPDLKEFDLLTLPANKPPP